MILSLLKYWPVTNSQKEVLFLSELEELLELTQPPEFGKIVQPLFKQISDCLGSSHFQVRLETQTRRAVGLRIFTEPFEFTSWNFLC